MEGNKGGTYIDCQYNRSADVHIRFHPFLMSRRNPVRLHLHRSNRDPAHGWIQNAAIRHPTYHRRRHCRLHFLSMAYLWHDFHLRHFKIELFTMHNFRVSRQTVFRA